MKRELVKMGTQEVQADKGSLLFKAPREWLVERGLKMGSPVFRVVIVDAQMRPIEIRYSLEKVPWSRKGKVRNRNGTGQICIDREAAQKLGIVVGSKVGLTVNTRHRFLIVRREG